MLVGWRLHFEASSLKGNRVVYMELPKIGSKSLCLQNIQISRLIHHDPPRICGRFDYDWKRSSKEDLSWLRLPQHGYIISHHRHYVGKPDRKKAPVAVFQTLGDSDFSSPVTPGNTANLGNGPLGRWAIPWIYPWGWLNSTHFFEVIGGDLLWMICWFYIIKHAQFGNCGHPWSHSCCWHRWGAKNIFATSDIESETMFQSWQTILETSWHSVARTKSVNIGYPSSMSIYD